MKLFSQERSGVKLTSSDVVSRETSTDQQINIGNTKSRMKS